jgi:hypothetical protein
MPVLVMLISEFEDKYSLDLKYWLAVQVFTVDNRAVKLFTTIFCKAWIARKCRLSPSPYDKRLS